MNIYKKVLEYHIAKRADITVVCKDMPASENVDRFGILKMNENMRIEDFEEKPMLATSSMISCGIYVVRRRQLIELVERCAQEDRYDFVKDIPTEKVYYRLEGYLFPETYNFYSYDSKECAHLAIDRMLKTLDSKLTEGVRAKISKSGYTLHEVMTLASIVELEAGGSPEEMPNVAAVFYTRLKSDEYPKLQSSPTQKYPYGSGKYDTYKSDGLPPGPLCSPSENSIKAAADPTANFDYYYFVTDAKMKFYYNKTLTEHNNTINRLKRENNWIGDK